MEGDARCDEEEDEIQPGTADLANGREGAEVGGLDALGEEPCDDGHACEGRTPWLAFFTRRLGMWSEDR